MITPATHPRDPLHGITLEAILNQLVQRHGWREMAWRIPIRCFMFNPTVKSSLTFLRKNLWAREKVEGWFISELLVGKGEPPAHKLPPPLKSVENSKPKLQ